MLGVKCVVFRYALQFMFENVVSQIDFLALHY